MGKVRKIKFVLRRFVWVSVSIILWLSLIVAIGVAFYLTCRFSASADELLPTLGAQPCSPQFYVYHFTDRLNRTGEREVVTNDVWTGKQTSYVSYEEIPEAMIDAVVAIEDKRFFEHRGVDWYRTLAAVVNYVLHGDGHFGGSTITQQLVKNLTGENAPTWQRKVQEILWARDLERRLDKTEILELYLNIVHFSDQCDGIAAAAEHYFSKTVSELTAEECAAIIAITNNPSYYNPIRHPQNNRERRDLILSQMHEQGYLDDREVSLAISRETVLNVRSTVGEGSNSWYVDMVAEDVIGDLVAKYGMSRSAASHLFHTGGLHIDMAMD
ncbi:MAG: penicillin-binding protein, partial [Clostridia bacterium]|nr:penicillin-binding protein [Clostridia bacterium]